MAKWSMKIRKIQKKMKQLPTDDFDTEFVDIDAVLIMYMEEFRSSKRVMQKRLAKLF